MLTVVGWGHGRHPCLGMRWAKLQQTIVLAYALAMFKWIPGDKNGKPIGRFDFHPDPDRTVPSLPEGVYAIFEPRIKE